MSSEEGDYPDKGELVVATVESVLSYGAFVHLDEYGNKQGMVSIKEFSRKWVKNPRDYLKEGQKAVLKVLRVNPEREHIDLSLKVVNDNERRNKLKEFKLEIRIEKLIEHFAKENEVARKDLEAMLGDNLLEDYDSIYDAFAAVANEKEDFKKYIKDEGLRTKFVTAICENITPTLVSIKGFVTLHSSEPNGVVGVKSALLAGKDTFSEGIEGKLSYIAPPNYRIDITAEDYKSAEKSMKACYETIEKVANKNHATFEFNKKLKAKA